MFNVAVEITGRSKRRPVYRQRSGTGHDQCADPASTFLGVRKELRCVPVLRFGFSPHRVRHPPNEVRPPVFFVTSSSGSNPYRLKRGAESMSGVLNQLNWRGDTRFIQLSGLLPAGSALPSQNEVIGFSTATRCSDKVCRIPEKQGLALTSYNRILSIHEEM